MTTYRLIVLILLIPAASYSQDLKIQFSKPSYFQIDSIERFTNHKIINRDSTTFQNDNILDLSKLKDLCNKQFIKQLTPIEIKINYLYSIIDSSINLIEYSWDSDTKGKELIFNQLKKNKKQISKYFKNSGRTDYNDAFVNDWAGQITTWSNKTVNVKQWFFLTTQNKIGIKVFVFWN